MRTHQDSIFIINVEGSQECFPAIWARKDGKSLHLDALANPFSEREETVSQDCEIVCLPVACIRIKKWESYPRIIEAEYAMVLVRKCKDTKEYRRIGMILPWRGW
jgi:hypothetical protein